VNLHVEYRRSNQVYEDVVSNVVDLGLVAYPIRNAELEIFPLGKDPLVLICHPQHPLARHAAIKVKSLEGLNMVGFERDIPTRKAVDRILREAHVGVKHVMEFDNVETVKRAVEIDSGVAIVPQSSVIQEVQNQTLASVTFENGKYFRPLAAIYKRSRVLSPAIKQFLAFLKTEV
jgi:DNA-binding transcriptional LysR family regulator